MNENEFLEIDGSFGEGGGAILRLSAGFSVLFNIPIKIKNIRANRPKPGLRLQHLLGLKSLSELTSSNLSSCKIGTTELSLLPEKNFKKKLNINISTAANIGLLLQPIQIASLGCKDTGHIEISLSGGGTFGKWAPSLNYLQKVTYPIFAKAGLTINIHIHKHGWYPKGGAQVKCVIEPSKKKLKPVNLTELGNLNLIQGEIILTNQLRRKGDNIAVRVRKTIIQTLKKNLKIDMDIRYKYVDSLSPGIGLSLWSESNTGAIISTGTILGEKRLSSEKLGIMAANEILKYIQNDIPVDNYLSDQLLPLMAYIGAPSSIKVLEVTSHARTNLDLIKLFTNREYRITREKKGFIIEYL
jgi:RNA 3'-terminal phosphate cyclase (ATP)/RNA 3'-terminal phosphate cyclase (GTP)